MTVFTRKNIEVHNFRNFDDSLISTVKSGAECFMKKVLRFLWHCWNNLSFHSDVNPRQFLSLIILRCQKLHNDWLRNQSQIKPFKLTSLALRSHSPHCHVHSNKPAHHVQCSRIVMIWFTLSKILIFVAPCANRYRPRVCNLFRTTPYISPHKFGDGRTPASAVTWSQNEGGLGFGFWTSFVLAVPTFHAYQ